MIMDTDKTDVTERASAAGWTLPDGFRVLAWTEHDDDLSDPTDKGDVYKTDVNEADYDNPTHAFCRHCGLWLHKLDQAGADEINTRPGRLAHLMVVGPGDWAALAQTGREIRCYERGPEEGHDPDEPRAVRDWRNDLWEFVTVVVSVQDGEGREWATASLGSVESGHFPHKIDAETGAVEYVELDPLTDPDHPLPDLLVEALGEAADALARHAAHPPVIGLPPGDDVMDCTGRATAAGWVLPDGFRVRAWASFAPAHDPRRADDPQYHTFDDVAITWWVDKRWHFVDVRVEVLDAQGGTCGTASLDGVQRGTVPHRLDPDHDEYEPVTRDPLVDARPLNGLITEALESAMTARPHGGIAPPANR